MNANWYKFPLILFSSGLHASILEHALNPLNEMLQTDGKIMKVSSWQVWYLGAFFLINVNPSATIDTDDEGIFY